jgi:flagellar protein FliO/FliZ
MKSLHRTAFHAAFLILLAFPASALAGPVKGPHENTPVNLGDVPQQHAATAGSGGSSLLRTFFGLMVVVGVIYGVYWILKQVKKSREERASGSGLSTLATLPLGPGRSLHMVRAGGEVVIIGVGEHGVTPIRTYTEQEAHDVGLIRDDDDLDGGAPAGSSQLTAGNSGQPTAATRLRQFLDNLRAATVRT